MRGLTGTVGPEGRKTESPQTSPGSTGIVSRKESRLRLRSYVRCTFLLRFLSSPTPPAPLRGAMGVRDGTPVDRGGADTNTSIEAHRFGVPGVNLLG